MRAFLIIIATVAAVGCGGVQCDRATLALWQDKAAALYTYRATVRCHQGKDHTDYHVIRSATPIKAGEK